MRAATLAATLEQDLSGLTDRACERVRSCILHADDDTADTRLEPVVRANLYAFVRAWAERRPFDAQELADMTAWCGLAHDGLSREQLLRAQRVAVDVVRDHVEQRVKAAGRRITEPSDAVSLLEQLGAARRLERQLIAAVETATTLRDRTRIIEHRGLEHDLVAALLDMPTDLATAHDVVRQLGLAVTGPWTVAAVPAARETARVRATVTAHGIAGAAVADRPEGVIVLANATPAAFAAALVGQQAAGIGCSVDEIAGVRRSAEDAVAALEISVARGDGPVQADRADLDLLLVGAVTISDLVDRTLAPLASVEEGRRTWMMETLEAYLDAGTSITAAARSLFLHRESMRYRVTQLRRLLGEQLDDPDRRLALHLAVKTTRRDLCPSTPLPVSPAR